jgi:hypothetical protein
MFVSCEARTELYMLCRRKYTASEVQWSEFLATDPEVRVRFLALSDFLRNSGCGTGSTQPLEYNWGATWKKSSGSCLERREYGRGDTLRWPRRFLYPQKLALTSPAIGGHSFGIVRSWTHATDFFCFLFSHKMLLLSDVHYMKAWSSGSSQPSPRSLISTKFDNEC